MKHTFKLHVMMLIASTYLAACQKEDTEDDNVPQKTLDKGLLLGKQWTSHNGVYKHEFRWSGEYRSGGTWEWKNGSDTMIIDIDGYEDKYKPVLWKFFWSEDHEMACKVIDYNSDEILFKDHSW